MNLAEWQSNAKLVGEWKKLIEGDLFKAGMALLREMSPTAYSPTHNADHATKNAPLLLGQIQVFERTMLHIQLMATSTAEQPKQPVAAYGYKPDKDQ